MLFHQIHNSKKKNIKLPVFFTVSIGDDRTYRNTLQSVMDAQKSKLRNTTTPDSVGARHASITELRQVTLLLLSNSSPRPRMLTPIFFWCLKLP